MIHKNYSWQKVLWFLVCVCSIFGFSYQCFLFLCDYFQYPTISNFYVEKAHMLNFPDVTVCGYSKYNRNKLKASEFCAKYPNFRLCVTPNSGQFPVGEITDKFAPIPLKYTFCGRDLEDLAVNNATLLENERPSQPIRSQPIRSQPIRRLPRDTSRNSSPEIEILSDIIRVKYHEYEVEQLLREIETKTTLKERISSGISAEAMIKKCSFQGIACNHRNFTSSYNYEFGLCYTFRPSAKDNVLGEGPLYGLQLELRDFFQNSTYEVKPVRGFRIIIHEKGSLPFPHIRGVDTALGMRTSIGIKQTNMKLLPYPHFPYCDSRNMNDFLKENTYNLKYNKEICRYDCMQGIIMKKCGCIDPRMYIEGSRYDGKSCDVYNQTESFLLHGKYHKRDGIKELQSVKFATETSSLEISREMDIFSNIGGQIGLFLGVSLLAFYEIIQDGIYRCLKKFKGSKKTAKVKNIDLKQSY
ncbi:Amiloride-sensitive sodium channel subunit gamma [Nymphon striatum]|nr:Amiloride-sensitive sodium channel subunit gamma [Nymphon striatum]